MEKNVKFFRNGKIYTSFAPRRTVEALITAGEKVLFAGKEEKAHTLAEILNGKVIDLEGDTILPGFIDSHLHLDSLGKHLNSLDLRDTESIGQLQHKLKEFARESEKEWILGRGWDQERFEEERWPTRWDLDDVVRDRPILLIRVCGHVAVLNTKAMKITGLLDEESSQVLRNEEGVAIGVITEAMVGRAREKVNENLTLHDYRKFLKDAMSHAASQGVTTVGFVSCGTTSFEALEEMTKEEIKTRIRLYLNPGEREPNSEEMYANTKILEFLKQLGLRGVFGKERVKVQGIKVLADGSLGGRTAWLSEAYADAPETQGFPNLRKERLRTIAKKTDALNLQLAVHGIGDKTIDMILDTYEELENAKALSHRIEHASVLRGDQIERASDLGVAVSVQPRFIISDFWSVKRLGAERAHFLYPFKTMRKANIPMGFGTDAPVEELNPWETIYAAITRGKNEGVTLHDLSKDEKLSLEEALHCYTEGSAEIMGTGGLGSLKEGYYADLIITDEDPFAVDENSLKDIDIKATYVGGKQVF